MKTVFVSRVTKPLPRWLLAYPQLSTVPSGENCQSISDIENALIFLDLASFGLEEAASATLKLAQAGLRVVVMSGRPTEQEAFNFIGSGARGYCHVATSPDRLREVGSVVASGQLWLPPGMVQSFVSLTKVLASASNERPAILSRLTDREYEVAIAVGQGANNKEIADKLSVSERTVKAHLTSCFEKLGLRDRVQLALAVNRLPTKI